MSSHKSEKRYLSKGTNFKRNNKGEFSKLIIGTPTVLFLFLNLSTNDQNDKTFFFKEI